MKRIHESPVTHRAAAFICGLCLLLILLLTAAQAVCCWIPGWWRSEYAKYDTPSNVSGGMSLDDAVHVTEDMLEYCIGRLDTLDDTEAAIDGEVRPFFSDREKAHLADCRELFQEAIRARVIAILICIALSVYVYVHNDYGRIQESPDPDTGDAGHATARIMAGGYLKALAFAAVIAVIIGIMCAVDFAWVFTEFHYILFDNDLWILYPGRDNLVSIMQEDVFSDAARWIAGIWMGSSLLIAAVSSFIVRKSPARES